jgi:hypothetical protein
MNKHMLLIGLFFLLLLGSVANAQPIGGDKVLESSVYTTLSNTTTGTDITASLIVFEQGQPPQSVEFLKNRMKTTYENCNKLYPADKIKVQDCITNESKKFSTEAQYPVTFKSLQGANFSFSYWNAFKLGGPGLTGIQGCENVPASDVSEVYNISGDKIPYYTATCSVKKSLYEGRKIRVTVAYIPGEEDIKYAESTVYLSDTNVSINFVQYLSDALSGVAGTEVSTSAGTLPCLGAFIILGLLLASMYFAGKSPVTLLDITTPRLPSPKGFTAGGQILAPYGYTELKRTTKDSMIRAAAVGAHVGASALKKVTSSKVAQVNALAKKLTADEASIKKAVALEALAKGESMSNVKRILKAHHLMDEKDHEMMRKILNKLERAGGKDALFSKTAADWVLKRDLMDTLDTLTYKGGKVTGRVQKVVGKLYGVDRYAILGPIVTGGLDSMLRSSAKLKDLGKAYAVHGVQFLRESGRLAVETAGGKAAMEKLKTKSPSLFKELTKDARTIQVGKITPMDLRMGQMYNDLYQEMHKDQIRYLLKQIYKKAGVNSARFTDEVLYEMAHKNVDVMKLIGYDPHKLAALERDLAGILASNLSITEKKKKLEELYGTMGGTLGTSYTQMSARLNGLAQDDADGHVKMLTLIETLDKHNKEMAAAKIGESHTGDDYYSLVGRGYLRGSDFTEALVFRRMHEDFETGHATRETRLQDILYATLLEVENRVRTLKSADGLGFLPEYMRDKNVAAKKDAKNRDMLAHELTDEGERILKLLTGKDRHSASLTDFEAVLTGNDSLLHSQGIKKGKDGIHIDKKTGETVVWEADKAVKPEKSWWKANMDGQWHLGFDTRDLGQVAASVQAQAERGHFGIARSSAVEATLDRLPGARTWSPEKREFISKMYHVNDRMSKELHNTFSDRYAMNGYAGEMQVTARHQIAGLASILAKGLREQGFEENHKDVRFLQNPDINNPEHLARLRDMFGIRYKKEFREVMKNGVTLNDIQKSPHPWVQTWEGTLIPYAKGMPVSDNDRVLGGHVALRDDKGVMRRYDPDTVQINLPVTIAKKFNQAAHEPDPKKWEGLMKDAVVWKNENGYSYEREKIFGALVSRYRNTTTDYMGYAKDSAVTIVPRHEAMPLAPSALREFGVEAPGMMKSLKPLRDFFNLAGNYLVRTAHDGAGDRYIASYDISPKSQAVKMSSMNLSMQIFKTDFKELLKDASNEYERKQLAAAYGSVALSHGRWDNVWQVAVDRNPQRMSTSHGAQQSWSADFQRGPAQPMPLRANLRGYMDRGEYTNFMAMHGWPALLARKAIMPYQQMIAGTQRSMQGYVSAHDYNPEDAMRPYGNYTSPRLLESLRFANPGSFSWGRGWASKMLTKMNYFPESSAQKAQLTGYDHSQGLTQRYSSSGVSAIFKGADGTARNLRANPGQSYTDTRAYEQMAGTMAEYLMLKAGPMSGYYRNDAMIRRAALTDTTRRTVAAEALQLRRQQEMDQDGILSNRTTNTFLGGAWFGYNMGIPGFPQSFTPKVILNKTVNRWRRGYSDGNLSETMNNQMKRAALAMNRAFSPHKGTLNRFCHCGASRVGPGICPGCRNSI